MYRSGFPDQIILIMHIMGMEWLPVLLPPPVAQYSSNGQWCESQINDSGIEAFSWSFSHLLNATRTDRTLCIAFHQTETEETEEDRNQYSFHKPDLTTKLRFVSVKPKA